MKIFDINGEERECEGVSLDNKYPGYVTVEYKSKVRRGHTHTEWYPRKEFFQRNPKLEDKVKLAKDVIPEDLGTVSSSGNNYIKDVTKNWEINIYKDFPLWISRGKGEGQQRMVIKNDKNTLYVDKGWDEKPDKSTQYVLSRNVQKNIEAMGNTLPNYNTNKVVEELMKKAKKGTKVKN